jgi:hypothetical protein
VTNGESTVDEVSGEQEDQQLRFLRELEAENASIAGTIVEIGFGMWAIHGVIPVDGGVLMAKFESYDLARIALDQLRSTSNANRDR